MSLTAAKARIFKWVVILGALAVAAVVYSRYDPSSSNIFPKCPFRVLTGLECPGCGSQRAIHDLLHLDIAGAFHENMLLVISIPYLVLGFVIDLKAKPGDRLLAWRKRLYGQRAIYIVFALVMTFWILRNIPFFSGYL